MSSYLSHDTFTDVREVIFEGCNTVLELAINTLIVVNEAAHLGGVIGQTLMPMQLVDKGHIIFVPGGSTADFEYARAFRVTLIDLMPFEQIICDHIDVSKVPSLAKAVTGPITNLSAQLARKTLASKELVAWPVLVESVRLSLAVAVIRKLAPESTFAFEELPYGLSQAKRAKVIEFIRSRICEKITVGMLASVAGMSQWHFARSFKESTGMTPMKYVSEIRVLESCKRIRSTPTSLSEIAYDLGFSSQSHMSRAFKLRFGLSPGQYRRTLEGAKLKVVRPHQGQIANQVVIAL